MVSRRSFPSVGKEAEELYDRPLSFCTHDRVKPNLLNLRLLGDIDVPGFALRFSEFPHTLDLQVPMLGEHNAEILTQWLDYTKDEMQELERKGILRSGPV